MNEVKYSEHRILKIANKIVECGYLIANYSGRRRLLKNLVFNKNISEYENELGSLIDGIGILSTDSAVVKKGFFKTKVWRRYFIGYVDIDGYPWTLFVYGRPYVKEMMELAKNIPLDLKCEGKINVQLQQENICIEKDQINLNRNGELC